MSSLQKALVEEKKSSLQSALAKEMSGRRKNPPTVTTAYESSSEDEDDDSSSSSSSSSSSDSESETEPMNEKDMMKIRREAIKLVNTPSAGPNAEAAAAKRRSNNTFASPYQQQSRQQQFTAGRPSPSQNNFSSYQTSSSFAMHNPQSHPPPRTAEKLSMADMVVNCVSEVCKSSSSELISKVLSSGYKSVNNYENPPVSGSWGEIDTSRHGYGNSNRTTQTQQQPYGGSNNSNSKKSSRNMPSRYQD